MERLLNFLLVVSATSVTLAVVLGIGWYRSSNRPLTLDDLSREERHQLVQELVGISPGVFTPALFNPAVGYTLRPGQTTEAWGDEFVANEIGYRSGPAEKPRGAFRVVFVGDSWAYGLGVRQEEAFPRQMELLANAHGAENGRVEAWTLALPGYNTLNQVAALETFFGQLAPDAVVLCPTINDIDSGMMVLPNGSLGSAAFDDFGDAYR